MKLILVLIGCLVILSCSRQRVTAPGTEHPVKLLTPFTVAVIDRGPYTAIIRWDAVMNLHGADTVKYKIRLNGRLVDSNLVRLTDSIRNLSPDTAYNGRVYAYTATGDTVSASFFLEKLNGFVFFGDFGEELYCYNLYTGIRVWQSHVAAIGGFTAMPTVANDVVYINGSQTGTWAFNAKTGNVIWHTTYPDDYYRGGGSAPVYDNGTLYTIVASGVYALNSSNGNVLWKYPQTELTNINPMLTGNLLITGHTGSETHINAINAQTGAKTWSDTLHTIISQSVLYDSLLIFGCENGNIYAFNASTGRSVWTRQLNPSPDVHSSATISPVTYHDLVIVKNDLNGYYGLKASTGAIVWNHRIQTSSSSSPAIGNDKVYFSEGDAFRNQATALEAATGQVVWQHVFNPYLEGVSPICVKDRVYFRDNTFCYGIRALNAHTGDEAANLCFAVYYVEEEVIVDHDTTYYKAESGMVQ